MNELLVLFLFITVLLLVYIILLLGLYPKGNISNYHELAKNVFTQLPRTKIFNKIGLISRLIAIFKQLSKNIANLAPKNILKYYDTLILSAGKPLGLKASKWIIMQFLLAFMLTACLLLLLPKSYNIAKYINGYYILFLTSSIFLGIYIPISFLLCKSNYYCSKVRDELSTAIDYLAICIEAGGNVSLALCIIVKKMHGPISKELSIVLEEISDGKTLSEALKNFHKRIPINEVALFANTLIKSESLHLPLGNVLSLLTEEIRGIKKLNLKQKITKFSIKMLIPIIFFIIPPIIIIALSPTIIILIDILKEKI